MAWKLSSCPVMAETTSSTPEVNHRANIFGMKRLAVRIISVSAVGSPQERSCRAM